MWEKHKYTSNHNQIRSRPIEIWSEQCVWSFTHDVNTFAHTKNPTDTVHTRTKTDFYTLRSIHKSLCFFFSLFYCFSLYVGCFFFLLSSYVLSVCASIPNRESGVAFFSVSFRFYVRFILFTRFVVRPELDTESNTNVYLCRSLGCVYCWSLSFGCVSNTRHCQRMRNFGIVWHFYVCICVCAINLTSHLCWQFAMLFITHSLKW